MTARAAGFSSISGFARTGDFSPNPTGYGANPYGYGPNPTGYGANPYGYRPNPIGYGTNPYGYGLYPTGYEANPYGYRPNPIGYGSVSRCFSRAEAVPPQAYFWRLFYVEFRKMDAGHV
jgi:hypothetical protein